MRAQKSGPIMLTRINVYKNNTRFLLFPRNVRFKMQVFKEKKADKWEKKKTKRLEAPAFLRVVFAPF